jgi:hypothetical protein
MDDFSRVNDFTLGLCRDKKTVRCPAESRRGPPLAGHRPCGLGVAGDGKGGGRACRLSA